MADFPLNQILVASAMLLLLWLSRHTLIKLFVRNQKITLLGDFLLFAYMIVFPSWILYEYVRFGLILNIIIFGFTYELYGYLLHKLEKIEGVGALSYFRKQTIKN